MVKIILALKGMLNNNLENIVRRIFFTKNKNRVLLFSKWFLSYTIVMLIPFFALFFIYRTSHGIIQELTKKHNTTILETVQRNFDQKLNEAKNLSLQMSYHFNFKDILGSSADSSESWATYADICKNLKTYTTANESFDNFYLLPYHTNVILTPNGTTYPQYLYEQYHKSDDFTYEMYLSMLADTENRGSFVVLPYNKTIQKSGNCIAFFKSIPAHKVEKEAMLVVVVDASQFFNITNDRGIERGSHVLMITGDNEIISSYKKNANDSIDFSKITGSQGFFTQKINGVSTVVSFVTSAVNDWRYFVLTPENLFFQKSREFEVMLWITFLVCLILNTFLTFYVTKKTYTPIGEIVSLFSEIPYKENKYKEISKSISQLLEQKDTARQQMEKHNAVLRKNLLLRILSGDAVGQPQNMEEYGIVFSTDRFVVMLISIDDPVAFFTNHHKIFTDSENALIEMVFKNIFEELINEENVCFFVPIHGKFACLINHTSGDKSINRFLTEVCTKGMQVINNEFSIEFTVAISGTLRGFDSIPLAYSQACETLEHRIVNEAKILFYDVLSRVTRKENFNLYSHDDERQLINFVKAGDFESASAKLSRLFEDAQQLSIPSAKCLLFGLINTFFSVTDEVAIFEIDDSYLLNKLHCA